MKWSDNLALCVLDYLCNDFGIRAHPDDEVDVATFTAAANICDETVTLTTTSVVGLTTLFRSQAEMAEEEADTGIRKQIFADNQFLWLSKSRKSENTAIPVKRNMRFQKFEDISFARR